LPTTQPMQDCRNLTELNGFGFYCFLLRCHAPSKIRHKQKATPN
jgi:hypothetical protein